MTRRSLKAILSALSDLRKESVISQLRSSFQNTKCLSSKSRIWWRMSSRASKAKLWISRINLISHHPKKSKSLSNPSHLSSSTPTKGQTHSLWTLRPGNLSISKPKRGLRALPTGSKWRLTLLHSTIKFTLPTKKVSLEDSTRWSPGKLKSSKCLLSRRLFQGNLVTTGLA